MNVTCQQENLAHGLAVVGRAVATRSPLPVLSNILLETDGGRLKLSATNLEMGISCWIDGRVEQQGAVTIPARLLSDFVNSLPPAAVSMELDMDTYTLHVSAERYEADIKGIDAADFPVMATETDGTHLQLPQGGLRDIIAQVTISAATDESRPILAGVLATLDPDAGRLTLAAADGFRLSIREAELGSPLEGRLQVIVPARALTELGRIVGDGEDPVEITITDDSRQVLFRLPDIDLVTQLITGNFPDYEKIVPTSHTTRAVVNVKALHNAVRIASFFARDAANVIRLALQPGGDLEPGIITVTAQAAEIGENQSEVESSIEGEPQQIAFNARYLLDILGVVKAEQIVIELSSSSRPGMFRPLDETPFTHVIMPMHIGQ